ncbi:hypothetical protein CWI38_0428p0030 [Hamiltosporidium tvaerminnensis]|uniref:Uncharacterized protein n=1 Tax=Hamiltosporidium tvaerminnensis TaxID=1176355 RepID=A0A4V2JXX5_9MICR|nr:hypothetical protein CWI38_0428p0030 [Hamiltosporidium tvaerminnensis]
MPNSGLDTLPSPNTPLPSLVEVSACKPSYNKTTPLKLFFCSTDKAHNEKFGWVLSLDTLKKLFKSLADAVDIVQAAQVCFDKQDKIMREFNFVLYSFNQGKEVFEYLREKNQMHKVGSNSEERNLSERVASQHGISRNKTDSFRSKLATKTMTQSCMPIIHSIE